MIWSPNPPEFYEAKGPSGAIYKASTSYEEAPWNLHWLFDYQAYSLMDGTMQGLTQFFMAENAMVSAALDEDIQANIYGICDLAMECDPVTFLDRFMRRPYTQTTLYQMCGDEPFVAARPAAERLIQLARIRSDEALAEAKRVISSAQVLAFPKRA